MKDDPDLHVLVASEGNKLGLKPGTYVLAEDAYKWLRHRGKKLTARDFLYQVLNGRTITSREIRVRGHGDTLAESTKVEV